MHPVVVDAARGTLPAWAVAGEERRAHMARVAALLGAWAEALDLDRDDAQRWRAAAYLHDALRDEEPRLLRPLVAGEDRELPGPLLHGPAAAARLRTEGVRDEPLLRAVAYHTVGDAGFDRLGRALYAADFLEPGRSFLVERRAALRRRMPEGLDEVVFLIAQARIASLVERGDRICPRTLGFWNAFAGERA